MIACGADIALPLGLMAMLAVMFLATCWTFGPDARDRGIRRRRRRAYRRMRRMEGP